MTDGRLASAYHRYAFLGTALLLLASAAIGLANGYSWVLIVAGAVGGPVLLAVQFGRLPYWSAHATLTAIAFVLAASLALGGTTTDYLLVLLGAGAGLGGLLRTREFYRHGPPERTDEPE